MSIARWCPAATARAQRLDRVERGDPVLSGLRLDSPRGVACVVVDGIAGGGLAGGWHVHVGGVVGAGVSALHHGQSVSARIGA